MTGSTRPTSRDVLTALYRHELELARNRAERSAERANEWRRRYAAHEPPPCGTCGQPLHPGRSTRTHDWEHRDAIHAAICDGLRRDAAVAEIETLPDDDYRRRPNHRLYVDGPQPAEPQQVNA